MDQQPRRPVRGHVVSWDEEQGWGVLASPDVPGEVWAHFSAVRSPDPGAYRALAPGEPVLFTWEEAEQDGHAFRAIEVRRASGVTGSTVWGQEPPGDDTGYRADLDIRWDDER